MIGGEHSLLAANYGDIEVAGRLSSPYAMPAETDVSVYVLRRPAKPLSEIWPALKHYD